MEQSLICLIIILTLYKPLKMERKVINNLHKVNKQKNLSLKGKIKYKMRMKVFKSKQLNHNKFNHKMVNNSTISKQIIKRMNNLKKQLKKIMKLKRKMNNNFSNNWNQSWWTIKNSNNKLSSLTLKKTNFDMYSLIFFIYLSSFIYDL